MSTSAPQSAHQPDFPLDTQHRFSSARLNSAPDIDLERLEKSMRGIELEIRALPRAAQLPPIPGLRAVDARRASLAVGRGETLSQIAAAPPPRHRKAFLRSAMAVMTSMAAVLLAGYLLPGDIARREDEFGSPAMRLFDSLRGELFGLLQPFAPAHPFRDSETARGTGHAGETVSPRSANVEDPVEGRIEGPTEGATVPQTATDSVSLASLPATPAGEAAESKTIDGGAVDAAAAVAMGSTYDPAVLGDRGVWGINADRAKARAWYQKAIELGSAEAPHLLVVLDDNIAAASRSADQPRSDEAPLNPAMAFRRDTAQTGQGELFPQKPSFPRFKRKRQPTQ